MSSYPFPCPDCRGRFQCHCEHLIAAGFCHGCRTYSCVCPGEPEWDDFPICDVCEERGTCVCGDCEVCGFYECRCEFKK